MADDRRIALITGASGGIGAATVERFRADRWYVVATDVSPGGAADRFIAADLADAAACTEILESVQQSEGRLDALVNNAAMQVCRPLSETSLEDWDRTFAVNARAAFWLTRQALHLLKASGGAVVNVSSVHAIATSRNIACYAASKGALAAFTRAAALELAPEGVRVNAVLPGAVDTPMLRDGLRRFSSDAENPLARFGALHPMGRVADPREIATAILFLASSGLSSYITGECLVVDGGVTARLSTE